MYNHEGKERITNIVYSGNITSRIGRSRLGLYTEMPQHIYAIYFKFKVYALSLHMLLA